MRARAMRALVLILVMAGLAAPALADDWRGDGHVSGVVRGPEGKPLAGAKVTLRPDDGGTDGPPVQTTDAKGKWGVVGIAGGRWKLHVEADGFITADGAIDVNDEGPSPAANVQLRSTVEETPAGAEVPQTILLWLQKGNTLLGEGKTQEARAEYEKALEYLPADQKPDVYQAVARTYFLEKNTDKAVQAAEAGLRIAPKHENLRQILHVLLENENRGAEADAFLAALDRGSPPPPPPEEAAAQGGWPPEIAAELAARPLAPAPNRPGTYKVAFTERSSWSSFDEVLRRSGWLRDEVLKLDPRAFSYDPSKESFEVTVPTGDAPAAGWGLLVWLSPGEYGGAYRPERLAALQKHHLIWVGANAAGNERSRYDRMDLALDAAWNMSRLYKVDPERVFVGGWSGGSRLSSALTMLYPDVFRGGFMQMGANFYRDLPIPDQPGNHWPALFHKPPKELLALAKERSRFVLVTGERDFNRAETHVVGDAMKKDDFRHVTVFEIPGITHHDPVPAEWLEKILSALDGA